jgi:membrane-bound lytic murein transglycosylase D
MPGKQSFLLIILLFILPGWVLARTRGVSDSVCFKVPTFQCELDSLIRGNSFLLSFIKYESENNRILSGLKRGIVMSDSVIRNQLCEMNSVIHVAYNDTVKQYIELLVSRKPEASCALLGLSDYYVPAIKRIFAKFELPLEFAFLPSFASVYNPNSISKNGATGYWKLTYLTGKLFNLEISSMVDERKDLTRSTEAAAKYLKELYSLYNEWTLALTAFVSGPVNVNKAIRRANGKTDFWSLYPFLPVADRDYLPAYIAMNFLAKYHQDYGIRPFVLDVSADVDTLHIPHKIYFDQISKVTGVSMEEIRNMNPQYRRDILPSREKSYVLRLPSSTVPRFRQLSDSIFRYNMAEDALTATQNELFFHSRPARITYPAARQNNEPVIYYTVQSGDNLGLISGRYHVTANDIRQWNHLRSDRIVVGQKLAIHPPLSGKKESTLK